MSLVFLGDVFKGASPGRSIWWPGIRTLPRSLQPEASGPGTGVCSLNALEEPGRWPSGGASCDSCFPSQRRGASGQEKVCQPWGAQRQPQPGRKGGASLLPGAPRPGPQSRSCTPARASASQPARRSAQGPLRLSRSQWKVLGGRSPHQTHLQMPDIGAPRPGNPSLPGKGTSPRPPHLLPGSPPLPVRL